MKLIPIRALMEHVGWEIAMTEGPSIGSKWKHYKGNVYEVLALALREEDCQPVVIYRRQEKEHRDVVWCRPLKEWREEILHEGQAVRRFVPDEPVEMATFRRELPDLLARFGDGKWALLCGEEMLGVFPSQEYAVKAGYELCEVRHFMVQEIRAKPRVYDLRLGEIKEEHE